MGQTIPRPELVAPAGDLEKLQTAVRFGADAVYVGGGDFSLRASVSSFDLLDLKEGIRFAHERACKVYLAMNIYAFEEDLGAMREYLQEAEKLGIDGVIVSDPGVLQIVRTLSSNLKIHLSTQANTTNSEAAKFWLNQGVSRIVVARELDLEQIKKIRAEVPEMALEIFIHGAMCVSYSGRCLLSKHLSDRSANRGECSQPCRWEYYLRNTEQDEEMVIEEDSRGTYILNSRDLCLIEHIPELVNSGISAFKIEGRMKTAYYVGLVTKIYRQAIDAYCGDPEQYQYLPQWREELEKTSHRFYTTGFYFKNEPMEYIADSAYLRGYDFVGMVEDYLPKEGKLLVQGRNKFVVGDTLELIDPHELEIVSFKVKQLRRENGEVVTEVHNDYRVLLETDRMWEKISPYSILRKVRT